MMYLLHSDDGQISPPHSVSAGLDYPGVGPEHSYFADAGIAEYVAEGDEAALAAFSKVAELEGIIPALETAHAFAYVMREAPRMRQDQVIVVNLSGRGDKDVSEVVRVRRERDAMAASA
jgi:tryptophan synthase beta chain